MYTQNMVTKQDNWWDFPSAVLLLAAIWFAGMRLDATGWIEHLELVEFLATSGCLLGLLIGKSRLTAGVAKIIGLGYSLVILPWQLSLAAPLQDKYVVRLTSIGNRLYLSFSQFFGNQRLEDPIFFLACVSILYWSFSLIAGYQLARYGRPWYPLAAAGMVIVMIEFYHTIPGVSWISGVFAMFLLLLVGRLYYKKLRIGWDQKNLSIDSETGFGLGKGALMMSVLIILTAWNLPLLTPAVWQQVLTSSPESLTPISWQERLSKIVAALNQTSDLESDTFGSFMGLGRTASEGEDLIFSTAVISENPPGARFYWRARNYDFYDNGSWVNTQDNSINLAAGDEKFLFNERPGRQPVTVSYIINADKVKSLFTAGEPTVFSLPVQVVGEITSRGVEDVNAVIPREALLQGGSYRETSLLNTPSKQALRETSQVYPAWVAARYLQLPVSLTQRTRDLALQITAGKTNPYDKAEAITVYLRNAITYQNTVPVAPANQEILDWFLFDLKSGYCNYYASAEVILLRSLGIPARLTAGYAQGTLDPNTNEFKILRKDSHAWPEVYFPNFGWVEFEPTTIQPELDYKLADDGSTAPNLDSESNDNLDQNNLEEERIERPIPTNPVDVQPSFSELLQSNKSLIITLLVIILVFFLGYLIHRYCTRHGISFPGLLAKLLRRRGIHPPGWLKFLEFYYDLSLIGRSFLLVPVYIRLFGRRMPPGATPAERIHLLNELEPATTYYGRLLLAEFEKENFSQYGADLEVGSDAGDRLGRQVLSSLWQKIIRW